MTERDAIGPAAGDSPTGMLRFNGTFTITSPSGERRTFRVVSKSRKAGERSDSRQVTRFAELLVGPDNENNYQAFAVVRRLDTGAHAVDLLDGRGGEWKRLQFVGRWFGIDPRANDWQCYAATLADLDAEGSTLAARGFAVLVAGVCRRCNRKLTVPESILSGIGPECAGKELE